MKHFVVLKSIKIDKNRRDYKRFNGRCNDKRLLLV